MIILISIQGSRLHGKEERCDIRKISKELPVKAHLNWSKAACLEYIFSRAFLDILLKE